MIRGITCWLLLGAKSREVRLIGMSLFANSGNVYQGLEKFAGIIFSQVLFAALPITTGGECGKRTFRERQSLGP
jgi:hypothetical protein